MSQSQPSKNLLTDEQNPLLALTVLMLIAALVVIFGVPKSDGTPVVTATPEPTLVAASVIEPTLAATPEDHRMLMMMGLEQVNSSDVQQGQRLYANVCSACHGFDAKGISGLGKTLIASNFVDEHNDADLVAFIAVGRMSSDPLNTTGMPMPARGGNPSITDTELGMIVAYVRSLNGATVINDGSTTTVEPLPEVRPFKPLDISAIPADLIAPSSGASGTDTLASADLIAPLDGASGNNGSTDSMDGLLEVRPFELLDISAIPSDLIAPSDGASGTVDFATLTGEQAYEWACASCHGDGVGDSTAQYPLTESDLQSTQLEALLTQNSPITFTSDFVHPQGDAFPPLTREQLALLLQTLTSR